MEAVQLGEVVRFAEFAWRLYELGWSEDLQAGKGPQSVVDPFQDGG